jgi:hypothetical protein
MKPWIAALVAAAAAACDGSLPPPRVLSISPSGMLESDAVEVEVEVEVIMGFQVNYAESRATIDRTLVLTIGPLEVGSGRYEPNGLLHAFVPSRLPAGTHNVAVQLADSRRGTLASAFIVQPGIWPGGFTIDPIGNQTKDVPFPVTIRATDPNASTFGGTMDLTSTNGVMYPPTTAPFENGVRVESVVFTTPVNSTLIQVRDVAGRAVALSNPFRVN